MRDRAKRVNWQCCCRLSPRFVRSARIGKKSIASMLPSDPTPLGPLAGTNNCGRGEQKEGGEQLVKEIHLLMT